MEPNIGIEKQQRKDSANMLNKLLAEEFVLYVKTLNYHWNVQGVHFASLHEFFKISYEELLTICDDVAERARALGEPAYATMKDFLSNSTLKEEAGRFPSELEMLKNLLQDHEAIIRIIRVGQQLAMDTYHDVGTNNFLCDLLEKHEKRAWMLRSFVQATSSH
jgi:starvation-inducible DNA-binding protein